MRLCQVPHVSASVRQPWWSRRLFVFLLASVVCLFAATPTLAQFIASAPAPTNLSATPSTSQVALSWTGTNANFPAPPDHAPLDGGPSYSNYYYYYIYRSTSAGNEGGTPLYKVPQATAQPNGASTATYTDTSAVNGTTYYYQVTAVTISAVSGSDPTATSGPQSARSNEANAMPLVRINGGGADYTDGAGKLWNADQGFTGGAPISTTAAISGTADPALYQAQRSGAQFSYAEPVANGTYVLSLLFAEIQGSTTGQRVFNATANGTQILTNYDIYADAGGVNKAVVKTFPVTVTNGQFSLALAGVTGNAALAAFSLLPATTLPFGDIPPPDWAEGAVPTDESDADGWGPSSSEGVSLPSGVKENTPGIDLDAYNPVGPSASFSRTYRSSLAAKGYSSPGFSPGWVHSYDMTVRAQQSGVWSSLVLRYPNGATETWTPILSSGTPTGQFTLAAGTPYIVTGVAGTAAGQWQSLTMTDKDHSKSTFTLSTGSKSLYLLTQQTNLVGRGITINYDGSNRLSSIVNDSSPMTDGLPQLTLLSFTYSGAYLSTIQDTYGRQITYSFGSSGGSASLTSVSEINAPNSPRWQYGYIPIAGIAYLNSVQAADPTGQTLLSTAATTQYDSIGRVQSLTDANQRQRSYGYSGSKTQVTVTNSDSSVTQQWTQNFAPGQRNADTGDTDALNHSTLLGYSGAPNPYFPTSITNRNNQQTQIGYDNSPYANLQTVTDPRTTVTTAAYDYSFPLGQVKQVQTGNLTATTYDYYPNGLIKDIISPLPGVRGSTVTSSYTYDNLGNVLTASEPGPNGITQIGYNYTTGLNGYTQTEALGEPVAVTVSGPDASNNITTSTTYYQYDNRGNRTASIDALGNETDYSFNTADQLTQATYPPTQPASPASRAHTTNTYVYLGGPLSSMASYDEGGKLLRQTSYTYGQEGEVLSVNDEPQSVTYAYDGRYRIVGIMDANAAQTFYSYDTVGNLAGISYPLHNGVFDTLSMSYDADNNLVKRIDGNNIETDYVRNDPESLLTSIHYPSSQLPDVTFQYDSYGRRQQMSDQTGAKTYSYDDLDNPLSVITQFATGGPSQNQSISYQYNSDGTRKTMTTPLGGFSYQYDGLGRMTQAAFPWTGGVYNYTYQSNGWLQSATGPLTATTYAYNARGFLTSLQNATTSKAILSSFTGMTYDGVGNRLFEAGNTPAVAGAPPASRNISYHYDNTYHQTESSQNNRLLTQEYSYATDLNDNGYYSESYNYTLDYNPVGNPYDVQTTSGRTLAHNFNSDNQIIFNSPSYFTYDGNGNPTRYNTTATTFDVENRMTSYGGTAFSAAYDGDGMRAWKKTYYGTTYFLYDGSTPVIEEKPDGTVVAANGFGADGWRMRYYPGAQYASPRPSNYYGQNYGSQFYAYTFDPQGNLLQRHAQKGSARALDTVTYDAFGQATADLAALGVDTQYGQAPGRSRYLDPAGFGGQWGYYTDVETGLDLLTQRYYDPQQGRFVTRDPIGYKGGLNLYSFTLYNPVNEHDPSGLSPAGDAAGVVGLIPGPVGEAANLASGLDSLREGDYVGAALSLGGEVPGLGEFATGAKILRAAKRLRKAGLAAKDAEEAARGADEILRLRHYTTTSGSRGIEKDGIIIAKDQNKVFTELARRKALSPIDAERKYLLKRGHGNAHVEFNARRSEVEVRHNPLSGATEHVLNGDVRLEGRNPVFTGR